MTTIVGIRSLKDKEAIVLASDLNRTSIGWIPRGDYAVRKQEKHHGQKIYVDSSKRFAVAMSGLFDTYYRRFLGHLLEGDIDLEERLKEGFFPELKGLNESRWNGRRPDSERINSLLIATNYGGKPRLYTCFPLGRVEERDYTAIGSGSDYALEYIMDDGKIIPRGITLGEAIDLSVLALENAERDIYTGGLDVSVILPRTIRTYGDLIKKEIMEAKRGVIERIKKENTPDRK